MTPKANVVSAIVLLALLGAYAFHAAVLDQPVSAVFRGASWVVLLISVSAAAKLTLRLRRPAS